MAVVAPGEQMLGFDSPFSLQVPVSPQILGWTLCPVTSALPWVQEKFSFFFFVPGFLLVRDCDVLSGFLHFPSETGNISCFLRIALFPSHAFRARNKEEEILTPISLVVSHLP